MRGLLSPKTSSTEEDRTYGPFNTADEMIAHMKRPN